MKVDKKDALWKWAYSTTYLFSFILLLAVLFLIWFSKYNEKPSTFVLPAVCASTSQTSVGLELEEEIFEPRQIKISQPKISTIQEISKSRKSVPRNFEKKLYFTESHI